ncbi:universal stress protein [Pseudonocardia lacus]|uniref:universal stress protein n=1 Tax=Pseudonocardia lacus TaxID=2835865 RepID=UPI001BDDAB99|nr:universal stress protein [Pseudonocardia lacus]
MRTPRGAVVVGVEDAPDARLAVRWAADEADRRAAPLHLVHALDVGYRELPPTTREYRRLRHRGERVLDSARAVLPFGFSRPVSSEIDDQPAAPALVSASGDALLTVVGARAHSIGYELLVGSVSLHLAHHAASPLVVVRESADPVAARVVVGADGSPGAETALRFALEAAAREGLTVTVLHGTSGRPGAVDQEQAKREEAIAAAVATWSAKYPEASVSVRVEPRHPARLLTDASAHARLLVVGSHGRGVLGGQRLGPVGQAALHHARCPVAFTR